MTPIFPAVVTTLVPAEEIPPLTFPGWVTETITLQHDRVCMNCGAELPKGRQTLIVRQEPKVKGSPTYAFCNMGCERQHYVRRKARLEKRAWKL